MVSRNKKGQFVRSSLKDTYFSKLTLENCYWGGFLAADGNIEKNRPRIVLVLGEADKEHLLKFRDTLGVNTKIIPGQRETPHGYISKYNRLQFTSRAVVEDLRRNFNITPAKTFTLKPPNITKTKQILAFIKGYIDGDGTVSTYKLTNNERKTIRTQPYISCVGTKHLMNWMLNQLDKYVDLKNNSVCKNINIFEICISGNKAIELSRIFSKLNTPALSRKWNKISETL